MTRPPQNSVEDKQKPNQCEDHGYNGCGVRLRSNRITDAIPLLWTLHRESPGDTDVLFNLGVACSEVGQLEKAIAILQRLIELDPHHVHGLVALGVAFVRAEQYSRGEDLLRRALRLEPRNLWLASDHPHSCQTR
jgi:tetratricopeptide (TPR) repeat protein